MTNNREPKNTLFAISFTVVGVLILLSFNSSSFGSCSDYTAYPPFLVTSIKPNVLFILDNSGSMNEFAYHEVEGWRCAGYRVWMGYIPGKKYYGYFNPDKRYKYVNVHHYFYEVGDTVDDPSTPDIHERAACLASNCSDRSFSGNWLNWWTMRRFDVAKKVLTGGKLANDATEHVLIGTPHDRDKRRVYNDYASDDHPTDRNPVPQNKHVYYTPFHRAIYSYFFTSDPSPRNGQFVPLFGVATARFYRSCIKAYIGNSPDGDSDLADDPVYQNVGEADKSYLHDYYAYYVAVKVDSEELPVQGIIQKMASKIRFGYMQFNYGKGPGEGCPTNTYQDSWDIDGDGNYDIIWRCADGGRIRNYVGDTSTITDPRGNTVSQVVENINSQNIQMYTPLSEVLWEAVRYFQQKTPQFRPEENPDTPPNNDVDFEVNKTWDPYYYNDLGMYVPCAKSYIILVSDGEANSNGGTPTATWPNGANTNDLSYDGSGYLDDIAFNMHTHDLREDTEMGRNSDKFRQTITLYTVFTFEDSDTARCELMRAARAGGFDDLNGDGDPGGVASDTDPDAFVGSPEWDQNGDNIPDTYFEAQNGQEMEDSLMKALTDILKRASSGTSATVLSERTQAGATMIQALFYPEKIFDNVPIKWVGQLNTLWLYKGNTGNSTTIREDTIHDYILNLQEDYIIHFFFQDNATLVANRCQDTDGDGLCDSPQPSELLDDLKTVFESGRVLLERDPTSRNIYTNIPGYGKIPFTTNSDVMLQPFLRMETLADTDNLINYIRGEDYPNLGWRNRTTGKGKVWKLGDIVYSTPKVVSYEDYSVIIVGANDGMLHAFKLGKKKPISSGYKIVELCDSNTGTCTTQELGKELWAYIPGNLLTYLKCLKDNTYTHLYYVDLTPFVFTYTDSQNNEHKILIGGMRLGGACNCTGGDDQCVRPPADANGMGLSSYFALDITNPTSPQFLWEFTNSDLGFTYSGPAVFSIGGHPVVAFLSGPTHYDGESTQNLKVFILTLDPDTFAIQNTQIIDTGKTNAFGGRLFVNKIGVDSALANRVFFGYTQKASGSWKGGVYKLELSYDTNNQSIVPTLTEVITDIGPVTGGVREGTCQQSSMIYFGEGRYFTGSQDDPTAIRRLYGVSTQCNGCTLSDLSNSTRLDSISSGGGNGWYIELYGRDGGYNAERSITDPLVYAKDYNVVFFTTFQPTADICGFGGRTFEFLTKCSNGGAIDSTDVSNIKGKLFLQVSTGQIKEFTASDLTNRRSEPVQGVPSEFPPTFVAPYFGGGGSGLKEGEIIHWLER